MLKLKHCKRDIHDSEPAPGSKNSETGTLSVDRTRAGGCLRDNVLIIGGNSTLAQALSSGPQLAPVARSIVRSGNTPSAQIVDRYDKIPNSTFEGADIIVNCVGTPIGTAEELHSTNVVVARSAAEQGKKAGARLFVQISSLSVYGDARWIDHGTPTRPETDYGRSKLAADLAVLDLATPDFGVLVARIPMLLGTSRHSKIARLASVMRRFRVFPSPPVMSRRSMLSYVDAAAVLEHLIIRRALGVAHIGDPLLFDFALLSRAIARHDGAPVSLPALPSILFDAVKMAAPGFYQSLYGDSVIQPEANAAVSVELPLGLEAALDQLIASMGKL